MSSKALQQAPDWRVSRWFNTDRPLSLQDLRGRIVVLHAFQMLCPGCVLHGLPQAQRVRELFDERDVAVIGLHSVFEHHDVMTPAALEAFIHEYRLEFPIGVDEADEQPLPWTMRTYGMRGTPTLVLIDRAGFIRRHSFGREDDLRLGAEIGVLLREPALSREARKDPAQSVCTDEFCAP